MFSTDARRGQVNCEEGSKVSDNLQDVPPIRGAEHIAAKNLPPRTFFVDHFEDRYSSSPVFVREPPALEFWKLFAQEPV